ncbi:MAG: hypothetical protein D6755_02860, partial [Anaerolineae bacterium]
MKSIARDSLITIAAYFFTALFNYGFSVVMGWLLEPEAFGRLSVALTLYMLGATLLVSGFPWVVARELARVQADREKKRIFKSALIGNTIFGLVLAALLQIACLVGWLPLGREYAALIAVVAMGLMLMGPQAVWRNALRGFFRLDAFGAAQVLEASSGLAIGAIGALLGFGAVGAVFGQTGSILVTLCFTAFLLRRFRFWEARGWASVETYTAGVFFFLGTASITYLMHLDVLGVKFFTLADADRQAGFFQVAVTLARPPAFIALAIANAVFPHLARVAHNPIEARRTLAKVLQWSLLGLLPLHLGLALLAPQLIGLLYPPEFAPAGGMLRILALCTMPLDVLFLLVAALQAFGEVRLPALTLLVALGMEWAGMHLLIPLTGPIGAGIALGVAAGTATLALGVV